MQKQPIFRSLIALAILLGVVWSCKKEDPAPVKSTEKAISTFTFSGISPAVTASISATTISAGVPFSVDVTTLVPTITVSTKATVSPASGSAQNFTNPVTYTVTAEDGTSQKYTVTVTKGAAPKSAEKIILTFGFNALSPAVAASISGLNITATLPSGTDATKLVPTITLSPKATVSPATGTSQDFSKAVTYTVTAEDGSTQAYSVVVTVEKPVDGGIVYIGNYDGVFYALDALTGTKKWQVQMPGGISATPAVADGIVYISCLDKKIYALDVTNGAKKWEFLHEKPNDSSAPMVVNGLIYLGGDKKIYCLDASSGVKKWEFEGSGIYGWEASPTVVNGIVYGIIRGNTGGTYGMYALDAITGAKKWGPQNDYYLSESSPAIANGIVYAGSELNGFVAVDAATGARKWLFGDINGFNITVSSPTISNNVVFYGTTREKKVYALDANSGVKKWEFLTGGAIYSSPIVSNGIVYVGSADYKLYAIDATTGVKKWDVTPQEFEWVESSPVIYNGVVYVGVGKSVYAYDASTGAKKWAFLSARGFGSSSACIVDKDGKVFYPGISGIVQ